MKLFLERLFRRAVKSTEYLPQVDGIRFIAITWVFLLHCATYTGATWGRPVDMSPFWRMIYGGDKGVPIFFVLSGFVIGLPFARFYLKKEAKISLKNFYLRRIIRLEPPYIVAMGFWAILMILKAPELSASILKHLGISLAYLHNFIYRSCSTINESAWSLEVEFQFYPIAPLVACLFSLQKKIRRAIFLALAICFCLAQFYFSTGFIGLYQFFHLFLLGMLIADFYVTGFPAVVYKKWMASCCILLFGLMVWLPVHTHRWATASFPFVTAVWMGIALSNAYVKKWLSIKWLSLIGGMCYSIYLIHSPLLELLSSYLSPARPDASFILALLTDMLLYIPVTLLLSAVFFLLIEKPFMKLGVRLTSSGKKPFSSTKDS